MTQQPPGPKGGIFGLKNVSSFQGSPLDFLTRTAHDYDSDIISIPFGMYTFYLLKHPDYIRDVLVNQGDKIIKWPRQTKVWGKSIGDASFNTEGDFWRRQRRMLQPAFHSQRIKNYIQLIQQHTQQMLDEWQDGESYEIMEEMSRVTLSIISEILCDIKDIHQDAAELGESLLVIMEMLTLETLTLFPVPDWVPTPRNLRENHAMKLWDDYVMELIQKRRAEDSDHGDVLSSLLLVVDEEEDGGRMTDRQVCDEIKALLSAGHETTSLLMTWTLYLLAEHPEIEAKLYEEVHQVLNGRMPTLADLETMTYTDKVLRESMRMFPPAWSLMAREVVSDLTVGGYTIPKGATLLISPWVMHHDPRFFAEPQQFDPERFDGDYKARIPAYAYFPFGGGPHVCTGNHLAMMEAEVLLAAMVERFEFELIPKQTIVPQALVTTRPQFGVRLRLHKRKN